MKVINNLFYKKATDINLEYPILEVYEDEGGEIIIDIEVTHSKQVKFNFYTSFSFSLNVSLVKELINKADEFYINEVKE